MQLGRGVHPARDRPALHVCQQGGAAAQQAAHGQVGAGVWRLVCGCGCMWCVGVCVEGGRGAIRGLVVARHLQAVSRGSVGAHTQFICLLLSTRQAALRQYARRVPTLPCWRLLCLLRVLCSFAKLLEEGPGARAALPAGAPATEAAPTQQEQHKQAAAQAAAVQHAAEAEQAAAAQHAPAANGEHWTEQGGCHA